MTSTAERLIETLRAEILALGQQGGVVTPSVYDTAQVLRYAPPVDPQPVIDWLLRQQHVDGGWGPEVMPLARHVPTLAAVLALLVSSDSPGSHDAAARGLDFLRRTAELWSFEQALPDDIPVAVELVLPRLLEDAAALGLELPQQPFRLLRTLGERRRGLIARMKLRAGTTPIHAWEAWGTQAEPAVVDSSKGVGNSPAATALWLHRRRESFPDGAQELRGAEEFLARASAATRTGIPGAVPTVWPIPGFELPWGLLALRSTGLLSHPALQDVLRPQWEQLQRGLKPEGMGMSDNFDVDGDITATTVALLANAGHEVDGRVLERYRREGLFITYSHELQPSLTTTAHGVLALAMLGQDASQPLRFLLEKRGHNGVWVGDKWHCSWLYATSQVMGALAQAGAAAELRASAEAMIALQRDDGGWGVGTASSASETAFAVHAMHGLRSAPGACGVAVRRALRKAAAWLTAWEAAPGAAETMWIGKELYGPVRVDRVFVLSAQLALELDRELLSR
ncbi:hypothetical protein [Cystobacter ferrugineus]|uniref:Squalene cyclase C-terminal domain-containing protein n=1 Tax=Cystobacter ferrugineus TaxID=83449 RepID=A0A1L9B9D0_9BACT|nr:hypothetical protein [Cystobacter ferrugineus]OJH38866.1 hypothetical protein BON30_21840 [Cystobacter ferrugineus]